MSGKEPLFPGAEAGRTVHVHRPPPYIPPTTHLRVFEWNVRSVGNPPICLNVQNDWLNLTSALIASRASFTLHLSVEIVNQTLN